MIYRYRWCWRTLYTKPKVLLTLWAWSPPNFGQHPIHNAGSITMWKTLENQRVNWYIGLVSRVGLSPRNLKQTWFNQWPFQDPKMEVPTIGLRPIYGGSWNSHVFNGKLKSGFLNDHYISLPNATKHHKPCQMTYQKLLMFLDPGVKPLDVYHQIFPKPFHAVSQS